MRDAAVRDAAVRAATRVVIEALEGRRLLAAGDADPTFGGGDGFVSVAFEGFAFTHDSGTAMAVQSDGKIVLAGRSGNGSNTNDRVALARLTPEGTLDDTFGDGGRVIVPVGTDVDVAAVAIAPDGKIVVAGSIDNAHLNMDWFVMRLNEDGSVDFPFGGGDGYVTRDFDNAFNDQATAVAVQEDGKIVVTGIGVQATSNLAVIRYDINGNEDPTFSDDGVDIVDFFGGVDYASDVIVDPDGKIVVVGGSVPPPPPFGPNPYRRVVMLRYDSAGVLDPDFGEDGKVSTDFGVSAFGRQVMRDPNGNYVVGGLHGGSGTDQNYLVARYDASGALDTTFGTNPSVPGSTVFPEMIGHTFTDYGIARQTDGKILFGGYSITPETLDRYMGLVRLSDTGVPDATFGTAGWRNYSAPGYSPGFGSGSDVAIAANENILLFGDAWANNNTDFAVFQLVTEGEGAVPPVKLEGTVLTVTGTAGDDVLTLEADNTTFTATLNGVVFEFPASGVTSISVDLKEGDDTQDHETGVPGGTVLLGDGNDTLTVGTANKVGPLLDISGGAGNDAVVLEMAFFTSTNFDGGEGSDTLTYNGGQGNDGLNITDSRIDDEGFFPATYSTVERVRVLANFGFDTINMESASNGVIYEILGGDGNDDYTIEAAALPTFTSFDGGPGTDSLTYNSSQGDDNLNITGNQIDDDGFFPATYVAVEQVKVFSNFGFDTINLKSTRSGTTYQIDGGEGDELFAIDSGSVEDAFQGDTTLIGGAGDDEISFDDSNNTFPDAYDITPTQVSRVAIEPFVYQSSEVLRILGGTAANQFNVIPSETTAYFIDGNTPATGGSLDAITVNLAGATGTDFSQLGVGMGRYEFANRQAVEFTRVERDTTLWGPTVKIGTFHYDTEQSIELVFSEETYDIGLDDLVVRNLTTGEPMPFGTFVLTTTGGPGIPTEAKWTAGPVLADGEYEARLPAASVKDWFDNPLTPDYVLNFRVMAGDANGDGKVHIADYLRIDRGSARGLTGFSNGDFNYSGGPPDAADYFIIDQAYLAQHAAPGGAAPAPPGADSGESSGPSEAGPLAAAAPTPASLFAQQVRVEKSEPDNDDEGDSLLVSNTDNPLA